MVLVVLFMLLLLSGLLAASLRLGLGSRQNTADQAQALRAQYAAESGLALVQSRLRDVQTLTSKGPSATPYMAVPTTTSVTTTDVDNWAKLFCGQNKLLVEWTPDTSNTLGTPTFKCEFNTATATNQKFAILANLVTAASYANIPASEQKNAAGKQLSSMTTAEKTAWWDSYLNNVVLGGIQYTIQPIRVLKYGTTYRFYMGASNISSKYTNTSAQSSRRLDGTRTVQGEWWFQLNVPNPFDNALMLNQWNTSDGGLYDDIIRGNLFTNQKIRFLFNQNAARFMGDIKSAGCANNTFPAANAPLGTDCSSKTAGFYGDINTLKTSGAGATELDKNTNIKNQMMAQGAILDATQIDSTGTERANVVDFYAKYIALPLKYNNQQQDASDKGLSVGSNMDTVEMYAGDVNEQNLDDASSYDQETSSWKEDLKNGSQVYQYISFKKYDVLASNVSKKEYEDALSGTYPSDKVPFKVKSDYFVYRATSEQYRADSSGRLYRKTASGWGTSPIKTDFNGVIFSDHRVEVIGPRRKNDDKSGKLEKIPPALASFSKINLTAQGGMDLDTDLTVSNTPCGIDNNEAVGKDNEKGKAQKGCPKSPPPVNSLALYAPSGDITMTPGTLDEATYHAAILASQGTFNVANYNTRPSQGKRHVVGAVVENRYGLNGIGTLSSKGTVSIINGYGDDFSQDIRFRDLEAIPSNPIAITNWEFTDAKQANDSNVKGLDNIIWKQGK